MRNGQPKARTVTRTYDLAGLPPKVLGKLRGEIRRIRADACELASHEQCATEDLDLDGIVTLGLSLEKRLETLKDITRQLASGEIAAG